MTIDPDDIERVQRAMRARRSTIMGEHAQALIGSLMRSRGLVEVERIETGMKLQRRWDPRAKRRVVTGARPLDPVSGDWRAMLPGGLTVLCEVKQRSDDQLSLSDLKPHQREALDRYHANGALCLVGWVHRLGPELLRWPIEGLAKGKPLEIDDARVIAARWRGL